MTNTVYATSPHVCVVYVSSLYLGAADRVSNIVTSPADALFIFYRIIYIRRNNRVILLVHVDHPARFLTTPRYIFYPV